MFVILVGVYSVNIDPEGTVTIQTTTQPHMFMELLQWTKNSEAKPTLPPMGNQNHVVQVGELQQLDKLGRLKHAEIVQSRSLKMTFNDHKDDGDDHGKKNNNNNNGPNPKDANNNAIGPNHNHNFCVHCGCGNGNVVKNTPHTNTFNVEFPYPPLASYASHGYIYPMQNYHAPPQPNVHYLDVSIGDDTPKCIVM